MKFEPHLPQLPSIGELLEHPRVKGVVQRINHSTVAQRAPAFSTNCAPPSPIAPAGSKSRRWATWPNDWCGGLLGEPASGGPAINATGVVVGQPRPAPPLADVAVARDDAAGRRVPRPRRPPAASGRARALPQLTGAEAALGAEQLRRRPRHRPGVDRREPRSPARRRDRNGRDRHRLAAGDAARSGVVLRDAASDRAALAAAMRPARPWPRSSARPTPNPGCPRRRRRRLAQDSRRRIDRRRPVRRARSIRRRTDSPQSKRFASASPRAPGSSSSTGQGCSAVPAAAWSFGRRALVEQAARHPLARLAAVDPFRAAALDATAASSIETTRRASSSRSPSGNSSPRPIANLQQRAERLAALDRRRSRRSRPPRPQQRLARGCDAGELALDRPRLVRRRPVAHRSGPAKLAAALAAGDRSVTVQQEQTSRSAFTSARSSRAGIKNWSPRSNAPRVKSCPRQGGSSGFHGG